MEAEIVDGQLFHDFKGSVYLCFGTCYRILLAPALIGSSASEHIGAVAVHGMPPGERKFQLFPHGLSSYDFVWIVVFECKRIGAVFAFEWDFSNSFKEFAHFLFLQILFSTIMV
ncbi:putative uncharacterized protein [Ruminococcus sp. CAG:403]|nr:putative uncharacterized protein [Ruminococcus sp. CAG:403]